MLLKSFISAIFMLSFMFASAQDSTMNKKKTVPTHRYRTIKSTPAVKKHIYRDTRLGSSSPMYNTYKKNDKGAGAITTNPNKGGGGSSPVIVQENAKDSVYKH